MGQLLLEGHVRTAGMASWTRSDAGRDSSKPSSRSGTAGFPSHCLCPQKVTLVGSTGAGTSCQGASRA